MKNGECRNLLKERPAIIRQYKYLYKKMLDKETIKKAWKNLRKGKTKRKAVKKIEDNFEKEVERMQEMIRNTKPDGYTVEHPELAYEPPKNRPTKIVNEFGKRRKAYLAVIREQWYFHIIVEVLKPIVVRHLQHGICGCVPQKGPHSGKRMIERAIREGKVIRNFFKGDVRHFYDNLQIGVILREMRRYIADDLFLHCIAKIYKYRKKGIMIGLYISPWLANFVMMPVDEVITSHKDVLYLRYVDDIVVFTASKKLLRQIAEEIRQELSKLRLKLKRTWQICKFDYQSKRGRIGRPLDFMGFVFFSDRTVMRKRIMLDAVKCAKKLVRAKKEGRRYYNRIARAMISRIGWFSASDSYDCYLKYIKPCVNIRKIKSIISKLDKKEAKKKNVGVERGTIVGGTAGAPSDCTRCVHAAPEHQAGAGNTGGRRAVCAMAE